MRALRIFGRITRRILSVLGVVVLLLLVTLAGSLYITLPAAHEQQRIPGLDAAVDISFDGGGIPRIRAATETDGAAALGYVHARDRMFSMELMRRAGSGRLSEIAGTATLPVDRFMRTLGLRRAAAREFAALPPEPRAMLEAYASGVNAWIAEHGRFSAPQFIPLGAPEPWTPIDSLLWGKTMGLYLSGNWRSELSRASLAAHVPREKIDQLWPPQTNVPGPAAAASEPRFGALPAAGDLLYAGLARALDALVPRFPDPFTLPDTASNEWTVDGRHSVTGAPLLAGDPHLGYSAPGIWYLARIETPLGVLAGATSPGVPFLVIGHNSRIAWTFTTTGADTQDLFEETALPDGTYDAPGGPEPFRVRQEEIDVLFHPSETLTVRLTRHGPVVSDLVDPKGPVYAAAIASLEPGDGAAAGLLALNRAANLADAFKAAAMMTSPVQNLLVADLHHIGQFTTGRVPLRNGTDPNSDSGDGDWPVAGADGAHDWTGWASGEALPHVVDPPSGHIVNANERVAPPDFHVFMGQDWFGDWRARRIRTLLNTGPEQSADTAPAPVAGPGPPGPRLAAGAGTAPGPYKSSVADFAAMQVDVVSTFAQTLLPTLRAVPRKDDLAGHAAALLDGWDGAMTMDAPQPLIFNAWMQRFDTDLMTHSGLPPTASRPWADFLAWVLGPANPAAATWCDGSCTPMLDTALHEAVQDLARRFGPDPAAWRWGAAHIATFADPVLPPLSVRIPQPGDDTTIFRGGMRLGSFDAVHGPGYRGVYDLANLDRSLFMMAPGQSGHPFSPHAHDLLRRWRDGAGIMLAREPPQIEATLRLVP